MSEVIKFTGHKWLRHQNCSMHNCQICTGKLNFCKVCQSGSWALSTECPGYKITEIGKEMIYLGYVDFIGGKWVSKHHHSAPIEELIQLKEKT